MELKDLIEQIDILEFLSQYTEFEQRGDEWWGLSPYTNEKTPSFSVRPETNQFYDFSSGIGGNVFTFVKEYYKCSNKEAVQKLSDFAGIAADSLNEFDRTSTLSVLKRYDKIHAEASKQEEVVSRPILCADYMNRFTRQTSELSSWVEEGIAESALRKFDVRYDHLSNRIVFPIKDNNGNIINVSGRTLSPTYKEEGLRKYTYFNSLVCLDFIYGFSENKSSILSQNEIILFEGAKSVMKAYSWGIENTGAILTSHLSTKQMEFLIELGCCVVFALDKDVDIYKDKNIKKLKNYVNIKYIRDVKGLLDEKDSPVDKGEEIFKRLYKGSKRLR